MFFWCFRARWRSSARWRGAEMAHRLTGPVAEALDVGRVIWRDRTTKSAGGGGIVPLHPSPCVRGSGPRPPRPAKALGFWYWRALTTTGTACVGGFVFDSSSSGIVPLVRSQPRIFVHVTSAERALFAKKQTSAGGVGERFLNHLCSACPLGATIVAGACPKGTTWAFFFIV